VLPRRFYDRDSLIVAPELLNKLLTARDPDTGSLMRARIVEVEAYRGSDDPGSHAFRARTARNASMFERPGTLYVYFTYGMHWCANVVCGPKSVPHAVLLRAAAPERGLDAFASRRPRARRPAELLAGPARLAQAFAIDRSNDGSDLVNGPLRILDDGVAPPASPGVSTRIGLAAGKGDVLPWRFFVVADPSLSRPG
jgi:DNA-3-methyladenine glycosylase